MLKLEEDLERMERGKETLEETPELEVRNFRMADDCVGAILTRLWLNEANTSKSDQATH